jgi:hypothetical protein
VHDYYSLERFKATYQFVVNLMVDKSEWRVANPGSEMLPPKLESIRSRATELRTWYTYFRIRDGTWSTPYISCNYSYCSRTSRNRRKLPE